MTISSPVAIFGKDVNGEKYYEASVEPDGAEAPSPDEPRTPSPLLADSGYFYDPKTCLPTNRELDLQRGHIGWSTGVIAFFGGIIGEGVGAAVGAYIGYQIGKSDMEDLTQSKERECRKGARY